MSRVGKKPVSIPSGVTANVEGRTVKVKGPKGALALLLHNDVEAKVESGSLHIAPKGETNQARAMWGTYRALVAKLIEGVTKGYERKLEITGVGYRAALQGKTLQLQLGYAHDIAYPIPEGVTITVPKPTEVVVSGIDAQKVGQAAAENLAPSGSPSPIRARASSMSANTSSARKARRSDEDGPWRQSLIERYDVPQRCGGASSAPEAAVRAFRCFARPSTSTPR